MFSSSLLLALLPAAWAGSTWSPLGQSMCRPPSMFGNSMAMAQNSNGDYYLAVGSPHYTSSLFRQGRVQVFRLDSGACLWREESEPAVGAETEDQVARELAFNCDGTVLAVGSDDDSISGTNREGFVQVYERAGGSSWRKKGQEIRDTTAPDYMTNFGQAVQLSCDGNTLAIAARETDGFKFRVYQYNSETKLWSQVGQTFGGSGSLTSGEIASTGTSLVVADNSVIFYYELEGDTWVVQSNITDTLDLVDLASDGTRLIYTDRGSGLYKVFDRQDDKSWAQVGESISNSRGDEQGMLSEDGSTVFTREFDIFQSFRLKTPPADPDNPDAVIVSTWTPYGQEFPGEDTSITSFAISKTGSVVAVGRGFGSPPAPGDGGFSVSQKEANKVEVWFFPDDDAVTDCYPNQDSVEVKECLEDAPTPAPKEALLVKDDGTSGGAAAGITLGVIAFILATAALIIIIIYVVIPKKQKFARPSDDGPTPPEEEEQEELLAKDAEEGNVEEEDDEETNGESNGEKTDD